MVVRCRFCGHQGHFDGDQVKWFHHRSSDDWDCLHEAVLGTRDEGELRMEAADVAAEIEQDDEEEIPGDEPTYLIDMACLYKW